MAPPFRFLTLVAALAVSPLHAPEVQAQEPAVGSSATYADLADLADDTPLVLRAQIRRQTALSPERTTGPIAPGHVRLYIEARTLALLSGDAPLGEDLRYLVDVPLDARGRPPKLKKREVLLFARPVPGRTGELQLIAPDAQLLHTPELEARLRPILTEFADGSVPPQVTGIRDVLSLEGALAGESETQLFLDTADDAPISLTIVRRPNQAPRWGASFGEIVDQSARAPRRDTLAWYRLACGLPETLPAEVNLSDNPQDRARAAQDYAFVREQLGECRRNRS